jgi:2-C-methyl-D-erythritol 4-phosphate cytidylyltransferase
VAVALLVAAGSGDRLRAERPKAFVALAGRPMLEWSLEALRAVPQVQRIAVALPPGEEAPPGTVGAPGGSVRSESVRSALGAVGDGDPVLVHDAARPLAQPELFQRALKELQDSGCDGAVAAAPVADTIKEVGEDRSVASTLDRSRLWAVQTPQAFRRQALERALDVPGDVLAAATDDAWLVERAGGSVCVVDAPPENLKITTPLDLEVADLRLRQRRQLAVVREVLAAVNQGRMEDPFAHYHDDVVWDVSRYQIFPGEVGEVSRGHDELRRVWRDWLSVWERVEFEAEELIPVGRHVVQFQRQLMRGRVSGLEVELTDYAQVWTFRGDKIEAMRLFGDRDEALRFAQAG